MSGFCFTALRSVRNAAGTVNCHDAHALANAEDFVLLHGLYIGAHAAIIFTNGNFDTLGTGQAFFCCGTRQATGHGTDHGSHDAATATAHGAAGYTTHDGTGTAANRGLGALDLDRTQGFDGTHTHGLHAAGFVTRVAVTGQARGTAPSSSDMVVKVATSKADLRMGKVSISQVLIRRCTLTAVTVQT